MIAFVEGKVDFISENKIVLDTGGIGYEIFMTASSLASVKEEENIKIFTYMNVSENEIALYGFISKNELEMFRMLITVSGIGPKGAMGILSSMSLQDLKIAIISQDTKTLSKAKGIGKKTVERMLVELKDKVKPDNFEPDLDEDKNKTGINDKEMRDAIEALNALGFSYSECYKAVSKVSKEGYDAEKIIKEALKLLY